MGKNYPILLGWRYVFWGFVVGFVVGLIFPYIWNHLANL